MAVAAAMPGLRQLMMRCTLPPHQNFNRLASIRSFARAYVWTNLSEEFGPATTRIREGRLGALGKWGWKEFT